MPEAEGKAVDFMLAKIEEKTRGVQAKGKSGDKSMDDSSLNPSNKSALDASIESNVQNEDDDGEDEPNEKNEARKSVAEKTGQKRF